MGCVLTHPSGTDNFLSPSERIAVFLSMALFNFPWPGARKDAERDKPTRRSRASAQAESIEDMRRRARHRLIGAAVLVLVGVIGFPLVFDTQPRPVAVDVAIDIPDRNKVAPLALPQKAAPAAESRAVAEPPAAGLDAGEEVVSTRTGRTDAAAQPPQPESRPEPKAEPKPAAKPEPKPEHKPETKTEQKAEHKPEAKAEAKPVRPDDAARARALLEGHGQQSVQAAGAAAAEQGRFIVQVGAFADPDKVREVRAKLERVGLKTYTQVVDTKDGKRTRVRLGPFESRAEADKAVGRAKGAGLSASVLAL